MLLLPTGSAHTSLPTEHFITLKQDKPYSSLPELLGAEAGNAHSLVFLKLGSILQRPDMNLDAIAPEQYPHSRQQYETDTEPESDLEIHVLGASTNVLDAYPNSSTPLTSLRLDPDGGRFMISGDINDSVNQLDYETGSRPSMVSQDQLEIELDTECNKQIPEAEPEVVNEEDVDTKSGADEVSSFVLAG